MTVEASVQKDLPDARASSIYYKDQAPKKVPGKKVGVTYLEFLEPAFAEEVCLGDTIARVDVLADDMAPNGKYVKEFGGSYLLALKDGLQLVLDKGRQVGPGDVNQLGWIPEPFIKAANRLKHLEGVPIVRHGFALSIDKMYKLLDATPKNGNDNSSIHASGNPDLLREFIPVFDRIIEEAGPLDAGETNAVYRILMRNKDIVPVVVNGNAPMYPHLTSKYAEFF